MWIRKLDYGLNQRPRKARGVALLSLSLTVSEQGQEEAARRCCNAPEMKVSVF